MRQSKFITVIVAFTFALCQGVVALSAGGDYMKRLNDMTAEEFFESDVYISLAKAVEVGDTSEIKRLAKSEMNINHVGKEGMTLLMWSILKQSEAGLAALLEYDADPNITTEKYNAMRMAVILDNSNYLQLLIESGGDVNTENSKTGRTIIFEAALHDRIENIKILCKNGADINHRNVSGNSVLQDSISSKSYKTALELLKLGIDPTIENRWGYDALDALKQFGDKGVDKNSENYKYYLLLMNKIKIKGVGDK